MSWLSQVHLVTRKEQAEYGMKDVKMTPNNDHPYLSSKTDWKLPPNHQKNSNS